MIIKNTNEVCAKKQKLELKYKATILLHLYIDLKSTIRQRIESYYKESVEKRNKKSNCFQEDEILK